MHQHNEKASAQKIIEYLKDGKHIALVSDAGTPNISDPGGLIVKEVAAAGFEVVPIPGVSAVTAAYSVSGMEHTSFHFYGFLPTTSSQRIKAFENLQTQSCPILFYEAPHRIIKTLNDMADFLCRSFFVMLMNCKLLFFNGEMRQKTLGMSCIF